MKLIFFFLHHVQGNQDKKTDKPLTIPEKINIDCDTQALTMGKYHQLETIQQNPRNPSSYPHFVIQGKVVIRHLQHMLRDTSQSPAYLTYLQEKFTWPSCPSTTIQWQIIQLTITQFKLSERRTITKFIHKWLPLQDCYHVKSTSVGQLCPSCQGTMETAQHFLACPHTERQKIWKELHNAIHKHAIHHNTDTSLHNLLAYGLYQGCQSTAPFAINQSARSFPQIYHEQTQLGWKQLYYGQYSTKWSASCSNTHPNINSTHYYAKCLTLTWQAVLNIWNIRNKHLHPTDPTQADWTQLHATVQQIFYDVQHDPILQDLLTYTTVESIMAKPTQTIRQWVNNCNNHMRNHRKAATIWAKLRTHDI